MKKYIFLIIILYFFLNINFVSAYNSTIVHPGITGEAINLYLRSGNESRINKSQIQSILKGVENEDIDPRYLNHFYNPYNGQSFLEAFGIPAPNAKEWAFFQGSFSGDYSVRTTLYNYRQGNTKRAFEGIGHTMHLIQDLGTPPHVRIDPHPPGNDDGLEVSTKKYARFGFVDEEYSKKNISNIIDEFAKYTYSNFYSQDRIDNKIEIENLLRIKEADGKTYSYGVKNNHIVCRVKEERKSNLCYLTEYVYKYYWQELYPKTVTYSASVIDWFMNEFEKIDREKEKTSFWKKSLNKIVSFPLNIVNSATYVWGDTYLATRDSVVTGVKGVGYFVAGMGDAVYYSGLALDSASEKIIKSTGEIVKEGTIGTIEGIGEASLLAGTAIEKTYDFGADTSEKALSSFEEGVAEAKETITSLPEITKILVLGLESEEFMTPNEDSLLFTEDKINEMGLEPNVWNPRENFLLFSGGSSVSGDEGEVLGIEEEVVGDGTASTSEENIPATEEDIIQDLSLINFEVFDIATNNKESTSSTTIGINIDIKNFENIEYFLSETSSNKNILWSNSSSETFVISSENGVKKIYLFVRDANSELVFETSIILDISSPLVEIISGPDYYSSSTEASFLFTANFVPDNFEYSFNGDVFQVSDLSVSISEGKVFPEGLNTLEIRARDGFDRMATSTYKWIVDTNVIEVFFISATTSASEVIVAWNFASSSEDSAPLKYFEFEVFIDDEFSKSYIISSRTFSATSSLIDNLSFRIRGVDLAGNIGSWASMRNASAPENNVLISEVGIKGSEFIELYNPGKNDVEIGTWFLAYYSSLRDWDNPYRTKEIKEGSVIKSHSYYLVSTVSGEIDIADDSFAYSKGFIGDSDGSIALFTSDPRFASSSSVDSLRVDAVGWGGAEMVYEGSPVLITENSVAIERKAKAESSSEGMDDVYGDGLLGNSYDSDNNIEDFIAKEEDDYQGSSSYSEPRDLIEPGMVDDLDVENIGIFEVEITWSDSIDSYLNENAVYSLLYFEKDEDCDFENYLGVISSSSIESSIQEEHNYTLSGLEENSAYCLAIKVFNGELWSGISNIVELTTNKAPIKDLTRIPNYNGYISIDRLTKASSPYLIGYNLKVANTLTIEPGVVVKFSDKYFSGYYYYPSRLLVYGNIIAEGTEEEPIIFTSDRDDEAAGDTNHDGSQTRPVPGYWGNIELYGKGTVFDNVVMRYAGSDYRRGFLSIYEDENIITNSRFENMTNGIEVFHASSTNPTIISNNTFVNCGGGISPQNGSNPILENNIFE